MPDAISPVTTGASAPRATPGRLGKDDFLKLLVAQLKYQSPMEPTDSTQFMAQSAQFTMIERLEEIGRQTAEMLSTNLVGRQVQARIGDREVTGMVSSVRFRDGTPLLHVGDDDVALADVESVHSA